LFGEEVFLGVQRTTSAAALRESLVFALQQTDLRELQRDHPVLEEAAKRWMGARLYNFAERYTDEILLDLPGRVAKTLARLSSDQGELPIGIPLRQGHIAELAHGSRQSVNRVLRRFSARGWLRLDAGRIIILDLESLERRAVLVCERAEGAAK
jgi:CRP-like cAMP-binding protein